MTYQLIWCIFASGSFGLGQAGAGWGIDAVSSNVHPYLKNLAGLLVWHGHSPLLPLASAKIDAYVLGTNRLK